MSSQVAVTGAAGSLGRALVRQLRAAGHQVRVLVRREVQAAALPLIPVPTTATRIFAPLLHRSRYGAQFPGFQNGRARSFACRNVDSRRHNRGKTLMKSS